MENDLQEYFLNPGELIFSRKPIVIKTILGSCVAVCLHDSQNQFGGMCHFLLPESQQSGASTKYGDVATTTLINKFLSSGSDIKHMEASVIGGAFIIFDEKEIFFIGDRNAEIATTTLKKYGIRIKTVNTGGEHGKRVHYNTAANKMVVQTLDKMAIEDLYNPNL